MTDNTLGPNQTGRAASSGVATRGDRGATRPSPGYSAAFTHTYLRTLPDGSSGLPEKICVNFYDVHGGGTTAARFQLVNGASEIQVDGNGDNSIETNAFNVHRGCELHLGDRLHAVDDGDERVGRRGHPRHGSPGRAGGHRRNAHLQGVRAARAEHDHAGLLGQRHDAGHA